MKKEQKVLGNNDLLKSFWERLNITSKEVPVAERLDYDDGEIVSQTQCCVRCSPACDCTRCDCCIRCNLP